jgi:hypothetical protein
MAWSFVLTNLSGTTFGELTNADERKVTLPHLRVPSATFKIPLEHPRAADLLDNDCLLECWRTDPVTAQKDLAFRGPIVTVEEGGEGGVKTVNGTAAGPFWRLTKRVIPQSAAISGYTIASTELGLIARDVIDSLNVVHYTGISKGTHATTGITATVGPWFLKNGAEAIAELSSGLGSFEYEVAPVKNANTFSPGGWPEIGVLNVAPIIGVTRPDAIFEYGGSGRPNVASYSRTVDRSGLLNEALVSVQGWPDAAAGHALLARSDVGSIAARGLFTEVVNDAGILDDSMREKLGDEHLYYRKNPRTRITFSPVRNANLRPFVHYKTGDTVRARATVNGSLRFDAWFRIWGVEIGITKNGDEEVTLEMVMP